ncbi:MAG: hypothetical protein ACP5DQ_10890 [Bacteroidales bacterium]
MYLTKENRKFLKNKGIEVYGKPLGRPPKNLTETPAQKYRKKNSPKKSH